MFEEIIRNNNTHSIFETLYFIDTRPLNKTSRRYIYIYSYFCNVWKNSLDHGSLAILSANKAGCMSVSKSKKPEHALQSKSNLTG